MSRLDYKTTKDIPIPKLMVDQVIGQEHAVNIIKKAALKRRNVLLIGSPGTGKSLIGQALAELLPKEKLLDLLSYPNATDENVPLIRNVPKGHGKEIVNKSKIESLSSLRNLNIIMIIALLVVSIIPYYLYAKKIFPFDSPVIYAASMITSIVIAIGLMLFLNLNKKSIKLGGTTFIPKLLIDNSDTKKSPFYDACLLPGQKVFANPHPVKIEESKGKYVYNAEGKKQKVVNVERKQWKGKIFHIKPRLLFPFTATQNHPFLVLEKPLVKKFKLKEFQRVSKDINKYMKWKKAEELSTRDLLIYPEVEHSQNYVNISINNKKTNTYQLPKKVVLNEELAEVFGWYLAEGYVRIEPKRRRYTVGFSLSTNEKKEIEHLQVLIKKIFNLNSTIDTHSIQKKELELLVYSRPLTELCKQLFGTGAKNKSIPKEIFESPKSVKLQFLKSYIQCDGWEGKKTISVATTSKSVADDLVFLFSTLGVFPSCNYRKMKDSIIKGKAIKDPWIYEFQINGKQVTKLGKEEGKYQHYFSKDNYHFIPIKKVWSEDYNGDIVNMETEDGTYLMPCITHNTGAHAGALLGDVLHDPLQSFGSSNKIFKMQKVNGKQIQIQEEDFTIVDTLLEKHKENIIKQDSYRAVFLEKEELSILTEKDENVTEAEVLSVNKYHKEGELIKLTTESGKELLVTPEHKVAIKTLFNKIKYIPAETLKPWHSLVTLDSS